MRRYYPLVLLILHFAFATTTLAAFPKGGVFSESVLTDAFENGSSLAIAEILSVGEEKSTKFYFYKVKVIRPIILGDLTKDDIQDPLELFAGASYGDALKPGSTYALFITKDCPYHFSWAHRDNVIKIDVSKKEDVQALIEAASRAYAKTSIRKFREETAVEEVELSLLPKELLSLCEQFRTNPGGRVEVGKKIFKSDLSSRRDDSKPYSSDISYLPPKISLSRKQILSLLGSPNLRSGWTYSWLCGQTAKGPRAREVGVLSATFDKSEATVRVLYQQQQKSKWTKLTGYTINPYVRVAGQADTVVYKFQRALKDSDWNRALSCCSRAVRTKAEGYSSTEAFLKDSVPIAQIAGLSEFRVRGHGRSGSKIVRLSFEVPLEVPEAKWPVRWEWSVVKENEGWSVDFKTLPVKILVRKELLRRELEDEDGRDRMEKIKKGIEFNLIPITKEFVIGQPMLFRIEMINVSNGPILYSATGPTAVMANDRMNITGPDGERIDYVDTSYQIGLYSDVILPDEKIVLVDRYDATTQYRIVKPGRYTFQFKGWPRDVKPSNTVQVVVKRGALSPEDRVVEKLLSVFPEGWEYTRTLVKKENDENPFSETFIGVCLIGESRGKSNDLGVLLFIFLTENEIKLEPELADELELWGRCKWGPVYAKVRDAELLWADYREQIIKALNIEEIKPDSDSNIIKRETDDPNMTKWGPKLSKKELARIARLSTPELVNMLKTGDTLHAYAALKQIKANGGWKRNFDLLLTIAAEKRGDMIVEGLVRPIKTSAAAEDKRLVDKYLSLLEAQLKKDKPSVSRRQAIRSIAQTVFLRAAIRPTWRPSTPLALSDANKSDPNKLEVPYANARVLSILTRCLNNEDWQVRSAAIQGLGAIGANDLAKADNVVAVLKAQLATEEASKEKEEVKAGMKKVIEDSLRRLDREINKLRYGNGLPFL